MILPLPCGCVADFCKIFVTEYDVALCPWCDSSFDSQGLYDWLMSSSPMPPVLQRRNISVKVGTCAYEVLGRLPCGCPEVRERGGKPFHLDADENEIELLTD